MSLVFGMKDITLKEIIDLVDSDVSDAESRIERMFDWHFQRDMTITKWVLGAAASLSIAVLVAFFKAELSLSWWQIVIVGICALASSTYGIYRIARIRSLHRQFVSTLKLYSEFSRIRPFIRRYRAAGR